MLNDRFRRQVYSSPTKLKLLAKSYELSGSDLGQFVRAKGLFLSDLQLWQSQALRGLDENRSMGKSERDYYRDRIQRLEKELKEARAIIDLQKKARSLLQSEGKSSQTNNEESSTNSSRAQSSKAAVKKSRAKQ